MAGEYFIVRKHDCAGNAGLTLQDQATSIGFPPMLKTSTHVNGGAPLQKDDKQALLIALLVTCAVCAFLVAICVTAGIYSMTCWQIPKCHLDVPGKCLPYALV